MTRFADWFRRNNRTTNVNDDDETKYMRMIAIEANIPNAAKMNKTDLIISIARNDLAAMLYFGKKHMFT